ncbi:MAG: response regulator [Rubrivivax sp.]|nr:response regulator [Pyrinomonadaceae bacterium]
MVVEDFDDIRQMIALKLRSQGYEVVEAANGLEALEAAKRRCPDLVVMDLSLPGLDGLSAVYRMRELEATCDVPVIACSAHDADIHLVAARAVGCDEYLGKPVDLARLDELISRLLIERRESGERRKRVIHQPMEADELTTYIDGLLRKNGGED